jgi:hypothetical protein
VWPPPLRSGSGQRPEAANCAADLAGTDGEGDREADMKCREMIPKQGITTSAGEQTRIWVQMNTTDLDRNGASDPANPAPPGALSLAEPCARYFALVADLRVQSLFVASAEPSAGWRDLMCVHQ